jgi:hypothetical protein
MSHEHRHTSVSSAAAVLLSVVVCRLLEYEIAAPFIHTILHPCDLGVLNPESAHPLNAFASTSFSGLVHLTFLTLLQNVSWSIFPLIDFFFFFFFLGRTRFRIHGAFRPKMWEIPPQNWSFKPLADWEPTRG